MHESAESWLQRLAAGDISAADNLWRQFIHRLKAYAEARLRDLPQGVGDADDVAASVFRSICRMINKQTIPSVRDEEHLWPLLAVIAARKVARLVRKARPGRPGRQIRESDLDLFDVEADEAPRLDAVIGREPSPELIVAMRDLWEELLRRFDSDDESDRNTRTVAELWLEGRTVAEIAQSIGRSERYVARKLAMIRRLIQELGGESPKDV